MKTQNLIASAAAVLFTVASLSAVTYNLTPTPTPAQTQTQAIDVVDLAPVNVYATAADHRAAALMVDLGTASFASAPTASLLDEGSDSAQFSLLGSQLAMPYYSFSNKFGRISKE